MIQRSQYRVNSDYETVSADEMRLAIVSGMVTGDAPVSYWPIFSLSLVTVLEGFAKAKSAQFSSRVFRGGSRGRVHEKIVTR